MQNSTCGASWRTPAVDSPELLNYCTVHLTPKTPHPAKYNAFRGTRFDNLLPVFVPPDISRIDPDAGAMHITSIILRAFLSRQNASGQRPLSLWGGRIIGGFRFLGGRWGASSSPWHPQGLQADELANRVVPHGIRLPHLERGGRYPVHEDSLANANRGSIGTERRSDGHQHK